MYYNTVLLTVSIFVIVTALVIGIWQGTRYGTGDRGIVAFFITIMALGITMVMPIAIADEDTVFRHHDPVCIEIIDHHIVSERWHDDEQFIVGVGGEVLLLRELSFVRENEFDQAFERYRNNPDSVSKPAITSFVYKYDTYLGFIHSEKERPQYCYGISDRMKRGICKESVELETK